MRVLLRKHINPAPQLYDFLFSGPITQLPLGLVMRDIAFQKHLGFKQGLALDNMLKLLPSHESYNGRNC